MRQWIHVWDNVYMYETMYVCMRQCIHVWEAYAKELSVFELMNMICLLKAAWLYGTVCRCLFHWYCKQTLTRHSWIHYTDCWIVKYVD